MTRKWMSGVQRRNMNSRLEQLASKVQVIAVLGHTDFKGIDNRQMPSGTGIDLSLATDGYTTATRNRKKEGKYNKSNTTIQNNNNNNNNNIASVIKTIGNRKSRLAALQILIEFGALAGKREALAEVRSLACETYANTSTVSEAATNAASAGEATTEENVEAGAEVETCTGSEDSDGGF